MTRARSAVTSPTRGASIGSALCARMRRGIHRVDGRGAVAYAAVLRTAFDRNRAADPAPDKQAVSQHVALEAATHLSRSAGSCRGWRDFMPLTGKSMCNHHLTPECRIRPRGHRRLHPLGAQAVTGHAVPAAVWSDSAARMQSGAVQALPTARAAGRPRPARAALFDASTGRLADLASRSGCCRDRRQRRSEIRKFRARLSGRDR